MSKHFYCPYCGGIILLGGSGIRCPSCDVTFSDKLRADVIVIRVDLTKVRQ